jgi:hypothetical protein
MCVFEFSVHTGAAVKERAFSIAAFLHSVENVAIASIGFCALAAIIPFIRRPAA